MVDQREVEGFQSGAAGHNYSSLKKPKCTRIRLYYSVFVLNLAYLTLGAALSWSSPVLVKLTLSNAEGSTVASMLSLGSIVGPFISGAMLDNFGRKGTVTLSMAVMTLSWMLLVLDSTSMLQLSIGRFLAGISVGVTLASVPAYIAEISENSVRGTLNTVMQFSRTFGNLLMYAVGPYVSYAVLHYLMLVFCALYFLLFSFLPDSPYWLVMKNKTDRARDNLTWLRQHKSTAAIEKELLMIQNTVRQDQEEKGTFLDLFTSVGNRRALLICTVLMLLQQISGISIIYFYAEKIFLMSGTHISSKFCSIITGAIMLVTSLVCPVAVKYYGYKKPMLTSTCGTALGMGGLGMFFLMKSYNYNVDSLGWLPLLCVIIYIFFFNCGFANIPWALSGEMFSSNVRSLATTIISFSVGFGAMLTVIKFSELIELIGAGYVLLCCSSGSCLAVIFVAFAMIDTSGLSFADIQDILNGRKKKESRLIRPA